MHGNRSRDDSGEAFFWLASLDSHGQTMFTHHARPHSLHYVMRELYADRIELDPPDQGIILEDNTHYATNRVLGIRSDGWGSS